MKIKTFILQTDASSYCVGAVLSQTDWEGLDNPVGYFSRTLLDRAEILHNYERMFSHQVSCQGISNAFTWLMFNNPERPSNFTEVEQ